MLEKRRYYVRRNSEYSLLFSTSCTVDRMKEDSAIKTVPSKNAVVLLEEKNIFWLKLR